MKDRLLLTIYFYISLLLVSIIMLPIVFVSYFLFDQKTLARISEYSGIILMKFMTIPGFWKFKITDLRKYKDFDDQCIIVGNHASYVDTLLILQLPLYKKFMMAKKFTEIPVFGRVCNLCGHVPVDRFNHSTTVNAIDRSIESMEDGSSFVMFPEGRRSENPYELSPFKTGAFRLAQETGASILPIVLRNSAKAMNYDGTCDYADIEMIIGESFKINNTNDIDVGIDRVRIFISSYLNEDKIRVKLKSIDYKNHE